MKRKNKRETDCYLIIHLLFIVAVGGVLFLMADRLTFTNDRIDELETILFNLKEKQLSSEEKEKFHTVYFK